MNGRSVSFSFFSRANRALFACAKHRSFANFQLAFLLRRLPRYKKSTLYIWVTSYSTHHYLGHTLLNSFSIWVIAYSTHLGIWVTRYSVSSVSESHLTQALQYLGQTFLFTWIKPYSTSSVYRPPFTEPDHYQRHILIIICLISLHVCLAASLNPTVACACATR